MSLGIIPKFSNIFPEEDIPEISDLLNDIPSRLCIGILSYINGSLYLGDDQETQLYFIRKLIERCNKEIAVSVFKNLSAFAKGQKINYINAFPLFTILKFLEWEIAHYRSINFSAPTAEQELKVFKAILVFNERLDDIHGSIKPHRDSPFELLWPVGLPQIEFSARKFFLIKIPSSFELLEYIEGKYPKYFAEYLSILDVKKTATIFRNIIEFFVNGYKKEKKLYSTNFSTEILSRNIVLNSFLLDIRQLDKSDYIKNGYNKYFKGLRKWPLIQHDENTFDVLNWNFVSDKLSTTAIIFDFYSRTSINSEVRFEDFKSDIGSKFSEDVIFKNAVRTSFSSPAYKHITPAENKAINVDYYLRKENHLMLLEFKDYVIPDRIKNGTYDKIKGYFDERFIISDRGQSKGILQLEKQIDLLNGNPKLVEDFNSIGLSKSRFIIYPVIVVTDDSFTIPGFNHYLNSAFKSSISQKRYDFFLIENLTVINLEFFIEFSDLFQRDEFSLHSLIHRHHLEIAARDAIFMRFKNPQTHIRRFESFKHTTVPKLPQIDPTETLLFKSIAEQLGFPKQ